MARKRSSSKKPSAPKGSASPAPAGSRSYMQRWREAKEKGYDAEKWGRLELDLGRWAQVAGIISGFVLGFTVFIASVLSVTTDPPLIENFRRGKDMALWFPLLATSILVSAFTVLKKVGPYRQGTKSAHFLSSISALILSVAVLVIALLDHFYVLDLTPVILWMYPMSVLGLALAFVSLAMTWEGFGLRKDASIAASLAVPLSLSIVPIAGIVSFQGLTLLFVYNAIFVMFSGSMLHLTASAADASKKEILKGSDAKIAAMRQEMVNKIQAVDYKEKAYVAREAELESRQKELLDYETEIDARSKELNAVQAKLDQQGKTMKDLEARLGKMRADVESKVEEFGLKEKDHKVARSQLEASRSGLTEREAALAEREKVLKRGLIDVSSRERTVQAKAVELSDSDARLKKEGADIDGRRNEVIHREKELQLKASEIKLKIEQLEAQQAKDVKEKVVQLRDWESKILAKEREVGKGEVDVRQSAEELKQRMAESDAYAAALQQERERLAQREQELNAHEKRISDSDSTVSEKDSEIERRWKEVIDAQKRLEAREGEYTTLFKDATLREADFSSTREEVSRKVAAVETREQQIQKWKADLEAETRRLNQKLREISTREKGLEQKQSDLSIKELEMGNREREAARAITTAPGMMEADSDKVFELRENRMREREEEFQRRAYQKEKEMEAREMGLREQIKTLGATTGGEASLETPVEVSADREGKLRTGIARLDDLLYGGFPMNANILYVGPAFVGKEVAILNFIAEGLKANVPAIIVTTSKPPVEISKEMAPVLPTFMEYEQLGLVRWIDASGTTPTQKLARDGNTFRVPNAADFEGLLNAVNQADNEFREKGAPYFRFACLTLSSSLTQADEKAAIGFVQRFVNRLRQSKCVAAFALERGMHTDQQVESLQQLMDGALHFKQEKSKTLMSVVGIGETQTRDWVPYKHTNKSIMIGSFQLERIR